jgi:hypothetical protein
VEVLRQRLGAEGSGHRSGDRGVREAKKTLGRALSGTWVPHEWARPRSMGNY